MRRTFPLLLVLVLLLVFLPGGAATQARAAGSACSARVAVLGADMSAGGRFEVQRALGVGAHTLQISQSVADEWVEAHGLVPADELGASSVASVLLDPRPAGSGLAVTLNAGITLDSAQTYANALLTAGVTDATVSIAAPTSQPAGGATAVLALLRAAQNACLTISPRRWNLAIREVKLSDALARGMGRLAAPSLLLALKADAVVRNLTVYAALEGLIIRDSAARHIAPPAAQRLPLLAFLHDLVMSSAYSRVARAHLIIGGASPLRATVRVGAAVPAASSGTLWHGALVVATNLGLTVRLASGVRDFRAAPGMTITRNGGSSSFDRLQAGDAVTVTTNASGAASAVAATAPATVAATAPAAPATATPAPAPAASGKTWRGTLVVASNEGVTVQLAGGVRDVRVAPGVRVTRDGQDSSLDALQPGDTLVMTTDAAGVATVIAATAKVGPVTRTPAPSTGRVLHGTLAVATNEGVTVQLSDGSMRDIRATAGLPVTRDGASSGLDALRPGDAITIWTGASGAATALDAQGPAVIAPASSTIIWRGTLAAVWGGGIAARNQMGVRDFRLAPRLQVRHNGRRGSLDALEAGDAITVTAGKDAIVTVVDADSASTPTSGQSKAAQLRAQNIATAVAMVALLIVILLVLVMVAVLHRRQLARANDEAARRQ